MAEYISTAELTRAPTTAKTKTQKVHRLFDDTEAGCTVEPKANWEFGIESPPDPQKRGNEWCKQCFPNAFILIRGKWITLD